MTEFSPPVLHRGEVDLRLQGGFQKEGVDLPTPAVLSETSVDHAVLHRKKG